MSVSGSEPGASHAEERRDPRAKMSRPPVFKYAVVDLASAPMLRPRVFSKIRGVVEPLFARQMSPNVLAVGPWLLKLSETPHLQHELDALESDIPWGYYIYASIDIVSLRHSLRRFNMVRLADTSQEVLFRYWDPRVMGSFLQICTRDQRSRLFEFIERIEAPDGRFDARAADTA